MKFNQSRIWTHVAESNSWEDNHYTTGTSTDVIYSRLGCYVGWGFFKKWWIWETKEGSAFHLLFLWRGVEFWFVFWRKQIPDFFVEDTLLVTIIMTDSKVWNFSFTALQAVDSENTTIESWRKRFSSSSSSSSSCRAISTDMPDPLSPPLPNVHRFR